MIVLGIDPGYDRLGIAVIEKTDSENILYSECFQTMSSQELNIRFLAVGKRIREVIEQYHPDIVAVEDIYFSKNTKTAMAVAHVRGIIIFQALDKSIRVTEHTPNQIKVATTGYGSASKSEVHTMVKRLINLENRKYIDDEIDAIAIAITSLATYKTKQ